MFTIWPTVQALYLSFTNATSLGLNNKFVGLDNYIYMFHDKSFIQALKNTAKLMAVVPVITIFCSLVLAFVLNQCKLKEMVFIARFSISEHRFSDRCGYYMEFCVPPECGHRQ